MLITAQAVNSVLRSVKSRLTNKQIVCYYGDTMIQESASSARSRLSLYSVFISRWNEYLIISLVLTIHTLVTLTHISILRCKIFRHYVLTSFSYINWNYDNAGRLTSSSQVIEVFALSTDLKKGKGQQFVCTFVTT